MKRFEEELQVIRQQMEEDFVLHSERIFAQKQSIERVERALEQVESNLGVTNQRVNSVSEQVKKLSEQVGYLSEALDSTIDSVGGLRRDFGDFAHTTGVYHETWASERKRNLRLLDVVQAGMLTSGLETEARFERVEQRLCRLEEGKEGAA